jgi:hypothetical protein
MVSEEEQSAKDEVEDAQEKFSFCIGRPWPAHKTSQHSPDNISVYAYGKEVHYGTMAEAEIFRGYVNEQTGEENFIYKLVLVAQTP